MSEFDKTMDIIFGRWKSQILYAGAEIGIFDHLTTNPKEIGQIAQDLNLDETMAYRILRSNSIFRFFKRRGGRPQILNHHFRRTAKKRSSSNSARSFASRGRSRTLSNMEAFTKND